jgi:hypothetical protein
MAICANESIFLANYPSLAVDIFLRFITHELILIVDLPKALLCRYTFSIKSSICWTFRTPLERLTAKFIFKTWPKPVGCINILPYSLCGWQIFGQKFYQNRIDRKWPPVYLCFCQKLLNLNAKIDICIFRFCFDNTSYQGKKDKKNCILLT